MAFGLDPLVKGQGARGKSLAGVFTGSMIATAAIVGGTLAWVGRPLTGSHTVPILIASALVGILLEVKVLPLALPYRNWLVPRDWPSRFGRPGGYALWGAVLGVGVVSYIPFVSYHVLLVCLLLAGGPADGAILGALYGLGRSAASIVPAMAAARHPDRRRNLAGAALDHEDLHRGVQVAALFALTVVLAVGASAGTGG